MVRKGARRGSLLVPHPGATGPKHFPHDPGASGKREEHRRRTESAGQQADGLVMIEQTEPAKKIMPVVADYRIVRTATFDADQRQGHLPGIGHVDAHADQIRAQPSEAEGDAEVIPLLPQDVHGKEGRAELRDRAAGHVKKIAERPKQKMAAFVDAQVDTREQTIIGHRFLELPVPDIGEIKPDRQAHEPTSALAPVAEFGQARRKEAGNLRWRGLIQDRFPGSNPPHGIAPDDGEKIGDFAQSREGFADGGSRGGAEELDHEAVFLEAAGDGTREDLG